MTFSLSELFCTLTLAARPAIGAEARKRIEETIEAERAAGDAQVASDIEFLLAYHDRVHAALAKATEASP